MQYSPVAPVGWHNLITFSHLLLPDARRGIHRQTRVAQGSLTLRLNSQMSYFDPVNEQYAANK